MFRPQLATTSWGCTCHSSVWVLDVDDPWCPALNTVDRKRNGYCSARVASSLRSASPVSKGKVPGFKPQAERHIICCIVTARRIGIHTGQQHGQCAGADGVLLAGIGSFHRYAAFLGGLQGALGLAGHVSFAQVGGQQGLHIKVL